MEIQKLGKPEGNRDNEGLYCGGYLN